MRRVCEGHRLAIFYVSVSRYQKDFVVVDVCLLEIQ